MTAAARQIFMTALQRKLRFSVIKTGVRPLLGRVAAIAAFPVGSLMHIHTAVAAHAAFLRGIVFLPGKMAGGASYLLVSSLQRKLSLIVVKGRFAPPKGTVAVIATITQEILMSVIVLVAADAVLPGFPERTPVVVATRTG